MAQFVNVLSVKAINHFEQNRPVHLARRDVYFELAAERIFEQQSAGSQMNSKDYENILFKLRVARQHAQFSIRDTGKNAMDEQFYLFLNLLAGNIKAILAMLKLRKMVEHSEKTFFSFLGANEASVALQAEEYQRRAIDIFHSILNTLKLAQEPFEQLKLENASAASEEELVRYEKARKHFTELVEQGRHRYEIAPSQRKIAHF